MNVLREIRHADNPTPIRAFSDLMWEYCFEGRMVDGFYDILAGRCKTLVIDEPGLVTEMMVASGLCESKAEAKRLISSGAVRVMGNKVGDWRSMVTMDQFDGKWIRIEVGNKKMALFCLG